MLFNLRFLLEIIRQGGGSEFSFGLTSDIGIITTIVVLLKILVFPLLSVLIFLKYSLIDGPIAVSAESEMLFPQQIEDQQI